jgi:transcriptional regulator GlxA family with amidase domain
MQKTVAIVVFSGVQSLDVTGPMDVFCEANRFLAPEDHYRLEVIGVERGVMACSNGLSLNAHRHFSEALQAYDLLLVAGGPQLPFMNFGAAFDAWLRDASASAQRFGSICNGAFILARAGLLDGRTVTTHWGDAAALAALCPSTRVEADRLYVQDGKLYTSAGVTAGIDLSLYLLGRDHGPEVARAWPSGWWYSPSARVGNRSSAHSSRHTPNRPRRWPWFSTMCWPTSPAT